MMKRMMILTAVWLLVLPATVFGFSATARVDRNRISLGDSLDFQVILNDGDGKVDLTPIKDFEVMPQGTSSNRSYVNGTYQYTVTYQYALVPKTTGTLTIPSLKVTGDDGEIFTEPVSIQCTNAPAAQVPVTGFKAVAELDTPRAVQGQQLVYTLRLLVADRFAGAQFSPPDFKGLSGKPLTDWKKYTRTENGRAVMVNEIQYLIQADKTGTFEIGPAVFTVQKPVTQGRSNDPFDSFFGGDPFFSQARTRPVRVISNPVPLTVDPLPAYTGKGKFAGLVGQFTLSASLDKTRVKAGDSATLTITVQGQGNVMDVGDLAPSLSESQFKVYQDAPVEKESDSNGGASGSKEFKLALVPKVPGPATIPPVTLTFFDTASNAYKTIATKAIPLEVLAGDTSSVTSAASGGQTAVREDTPQGIVPVEKKEVKLLNRDILEIREDVSCIQSVPRMGMFSFFLWLLLPGAVFVLFILLFRLKDRQPDVQEQGRKKVKAQIARAASLGPDDPDFLPALQSALTTLVLSRAGRTSETLTQEEAMSMLRAEQVDAAKIHEVIDTMAVLDRARFGGAALDREDAMACMKKIGMWARTLAVVFFAALTLTALPARASEQAAQFVDAVRLYRAHDYNAAALAFESIARSGVVNPDLYYDAGNAYLRANDLGRAILWYERALKLAPGDPDLRFNLAHARSLVADKINNPVSFWDIFLFWRGMVSLKTVQVAAIVLSFLAFTWAGVQRLRRRRIFSAPGVAVFFLFGALSLAAIFEGAGVGAVTRAVILAPSVEVRSGTMASATPLFDLHAGSKVELLEKKGNYIKISVGGDKVGWISLSDASVI